MKPLHGFLVLLVTGLFLHPAPARADGFISPTVGANFGGDAGGTLRGATTGAVTEGSKINFGAAAGWMGKGVVGVEEDFSYSPDFFGNGGNLDKSRVITLMTNLIVGAPIGGQRGGGIRPYVSGGVGLVNRDIKFVNGVGNFSANDAGFDLGAGIMAYFADNVGVRFDYRYFRTFQETNTNVIGLEPGHFTFNRVSAGVLFRF